MLPHIYFFYIQGITTDVLLISIALVISLRIFFKMLKGMKFLPQAKKTKKKSNSKTK